MENEPAFPCGEHTGYQPYSGMELRDYFAAKVFPDLAAAYDTWDEVAKASYKAADAMMRARVKTKEQNQ